MQSATRGGRSGTAEILEQMGGPGDQVFLDYDGTLVPISSDPTSCFADRELLSILDGLGEEYDMYIVTGRSAEDMRRFLPPPGTG